MITRAYTGTDLDIILITAEYYDDHPLSPVGVLARVLDAKGYAVGIIEKPANDDDFTALGAPRLFFGVTSGSIDSMVHNYTPLKRKREDDEHGHVTPLPDRALLVYCNALKRLFKSTPIVIGGIEASLRRFAHYDYWNNKLRRSILFDSRASVLVYGNGEKQVLELAGRYREGRDLTGIAGTCIISRELDDTFTRLPAYHAVASDPLQFCKMQTMLTNRANLAQEYENNYVLQYRYPQYTSEDLDRIYALGYTRTLHPHSLLKMARFSVVTHRGCIGNCNFCALALHQGDRIVSRSMASVLHELERLTAHPEFRGAIDDLGGPTANMYGMDCDRAASCTKDCLSCARLDRSHKRLIELLAHARAVPGIDNIFVRSGIRYDLAMHSPDYIRQLSRHHISGTLKIAPEHFSPQVLRLMNKSNEQFEEFLELFEQINKDTGQALRYYLMLGHPGDDPDQVQVLLGRIRELGLQNFEQFQLFTPTPMTVSTCMYWTGRDPFTLQEVGVVYDYHTKKRLKRMLLTAIRHREP